MKKGIFFSFLILPAASIVSGPQDLSERSSAAVVPSGGGTVTGSDFEISATIGQPMVTSGISNPGQMTSGFWPVANTGLHPIVWLNSQSFGVTTPKEGEGAFDLILSNLGNYPLEYRVVARAAWNGFEWLTLSRTAGVVTAGSREILPVTVVETANLEEGSYQGRLLVTTNTGAGLSDVTDTARVSLTVLSETAQIASGETTIEAGDSPPVEVTDEAGNSLGVTFDFSAGEGGTVSVAFIPSPSPADSTTLFYDPDSSVTDPAYSDSYWEISTTVPQGFVADIAFGYAGHVGVRNPEQLRLARRMNHAGPGVPWHFVPTDSVDVDESSETITARSQGRFSQWVIASERAQNPFQDTGAPVLRSLTLSPDSPRVQEPVTVSVTVTDESSLKNVRLLYQKGGGSGFTGVAMTGQGGIYRGVIPSAQITPTGFAAFIRAEDIAGHIGTSDTLSPPVWFDDGALSTEFTGGAFPSGIPKNRWRLISVPGEVDDPGVSSLFGDELKGEPTATTWRMFRWTDSGWEVAERVMVGEGYWVNQRVLTDVTLAAGPGRSVGLTGRTLTLQPGWNLIGSPYSFPVKLDVDQAEFYGPLTYGGDTGEGWSDVVSELLPWGGYALYNRENTARTLRIDPLAGPASLPRVADKPFDGWKLQLSVRGATYSDPANFIGRVAGAKDDLDRFDNPEPPYLDEYVSLAMDRPGWSRLSGPGPAAAGIPRFTSDIRSPRGTNGVWDIDLYVKGEEGPVRISPHLFGEVPRDFQVVLLDLMTREVTDLTSGNDGILIADYIPAHDFQGKVLPHPFKVIAGAADYVTRTVDEILSMLPEKVALFQNYPNPFNPSTRIRYALPRPGLVSLKVYNLLGQEVVTLVDEWKPGGYHRILWDGTDSRGAPVGTGIYIFRLHTQEPRGTTSRTRKMLLLK